MRIRSGMTAVVLIGLAARSSSAQWTNLGLFGGRVNDIAICETASTTEILIATSGRNTIYRKTAATWEPVLQTTGEAQEIEADLCAANTGVVWAIVNRQLYTHKPDAPWADFGWSRYGSMTETDTLFAHSTGMYLGGDNTVYRSTDGGRTLAPLVTLAGERIRSIAVFNPTLFFVLTDKGLNRCQNDGNGFVAAPVQIISGGVTITDLDTVAIDSSDSRNSSSANRFFVSGGGPRGGLYRTDDGGAAWTRLPVELGANRKHCIRFVRGRANRRIVVSGRYSDDQGMNWQAVPAAVSTTSLGTVESRSTGNAIAVDPQAPNLVYFSTDRAIARWDLSSGKARELLNADGITGVEVRDIDQVPTDASTRTIVWVAASNGLGKTNMYPATAIGSDWLFPVRPQDENASLTAVAVHPDNVDIVLAGDASGTIYRTSNGGQDAASWTAVFSARNSPYNSRYSLPEKAAVTDIKILGQDSTIVYAATAVVEGKFEGSVYRSLNNGTNWDDDFTATTGSTLNMPVNTLTLLDNMVWAGVGHPKDTRIEARGLYVRLSATGTANWWKMPTGTDLDRQAVHVIISTRTLNGLAVYAATDHGVFRGHLADSGASTWQWREITPDGPHAYIALAVNPDNSDRLLVAHDNAVWMSSNAGAAWHLVPPSGTPACDKVFSLLNDVLVGTAAGLFEIDLEAIPPESGAVMAGGASRISTTRPASEVARKAPTSNSGSERLLPFTLPKIFGLGIAEWVGVWLPILAWLAITRHNRGK